MDPGREVEVPIHLGLQSTPCTFLGNLEYLLLKKLEDIKETHMGENMGNMRDMGNMRSLRRNQRHWSGVGWYVQSVFTMSELLKCTINLDSPFIIFKYSVLLKTELVFAMQPCQTYENVKMHKDRWYNQLLDRSEIMLK